MGTLFEVNGSTGVVSFHQKGTTQLEFENGTSNPVSQVVGQVFWRSDLNQLIVSDGTIWRAINGGSYRVWQETPSGSVNSSNTVFTFANPYVATTTLVWRDGLEMKLGTDYTESNPGTGQITFTTAPSTGNTVLGGYSRLEGSIAALLFKSSYVTGTPSGTYTGSTTVFNLSFAYVVGSGSLFVYSGGVLMLAGTDYTETNTSTVTFSSARSSGEIIQFVKVGAANDTLTSGWQSISTNVTLQNITNFVGIGLTTPLSSLDVSGSFGLKVTSVSTTYTAANDGVILASASGGTFTITIPLVANRIYQIKKTDTTSNPVTLSPASGNIDGVSSFVLTTPYQAVTLACDGTNFWIL